MVKFRVDEVALRAFADQLEVLEAASKKALAYTDHTAMDAAAMSGSVLQRMVDACHAVEPTLAGMFDRLYVLSGRAADEMRRSARYYKQTTEAAAAEYERLQLAPKPRKPRYE